MERQSASDLSDPAGHPSAATGLRMHPARVLFARTLSLILIPPVISTAVFTALVLKAKDECAVSPALIWLVAVLCTGGLQIIHVLLLRRRALVGAYDVPDRLQRTGPYIVSSVVSLCGFVLLLALHAPTAVLALMWCYTANTPILALINLRWKISAHMMGFTGPPLLLADASVLLLPALLPLALALGWARVAIGAHSPAQVLAGAVAGVVLTLLQLQIFALSIQPFLPVPSM